MNAYELLSFFRSHSIELQVIHDKIKLKAPRGFINDELLDSLKKNKNEIIAILRTNNGNGQLIMRRPEDAPVLLSFAQQRLWFLHQLEPDSAYYNISMAIRLRGELNEGALQQTVNEIIRRHEVLRTTFQVIDGEPYQVIAKQTDMPLKVIDLRGLSPAEQEAHAHVLAQKESQTPFSLSSGPLIRVSLLRLGETDDLVLFTLHHIVSDGWSIGVLIKEVAALYTAYVKNESSPLPELPIQYADFAQWQRQWLRGDVLQKRLEYWTEQLKDIPTLLNLPTDHPRPAIQSHRGASFSFEISSETTKGLYVLNKETHTTLFMSLTAAFSILLSRYSGQNDICVGTPIANRNHPEIEDLVGIFVNTLVLRTKIDHSTGFMHLLQHVRAMTLDAYAYQDVPFEQLVDVLKPERHTSHSPLFQVMLALQNAPLDKLELPGLQMEPIQSKNPTAKFDLTLNVIEVGGNLQASFEYNTDLFEHTTIERMAEHFTHLLEGIVANPSMRIQDLPMLSEAEHRQLLVEWNATEVAYPQEKCVHKLFEAQVERTPDNVAVIFKDRQLTYRELNERANQLAHYLRKLGVGPDTRVGICIERSLEMIIGLLGILKAGGAYVPLDADYPKERLKFMVEDSSLQWILIQTALRENFNQLTDARSSIVVLDLNLDWEPIATCPINNLDTRVEGQNLAYIIYTSGSTGIPKGVGVTHNNISRLILPGNTYVRFSADEVFLQLAPLAFDASTFEIWGSLLNGSRLIIFSEYFPTPIELAHFVEKNGVTTLWLTAGLFHQMVDAAPKGLGAIRQLLAGGDVLSVPHLFKARRQWPACRFINGYGPTETTTFSCCYNISDGFNASVPIGQPIANTQIYILDARLLPVPVGITGELHIAGDGLARGYLNNADLTAEKFIPNPFSKEPGARMYKSGDLARWLPDGNIEFLGRIDYQVKIRGFRIELGEIEAALAVLPEVRDVVVLAREETPGDKRLVAYLVQKTGHDLPGTAELRSKLAQTLPEYMIPAHFIQLEQLPLTANGKVDRKALPAPDTTRSEIDYVAPRSSIESILALIWADVLKLDKVGIYDNFFELGGHSLLLARIHDRLRTDLNINIKMVGLFQYPTISTLAQHLSVAETEEPLTVSGVLRAQLRRDLIKQSDNSIAVIALTGRFPGAPNTEIFWQNLCVGKESITFFSEEELHAAGVDEELLNNPNYVRAGSVLENVEEFDAYFFGYSPREAALMDPQQRVFLESAWEALEQAGYDPERYAGRIGVYASVSANRYLLFNLLSNSSLIQSVGGFQTLLGNDKDFLTTRISYKLNLKGPSLNVQTACSSSLVAIHLACQSLLRGECDMALAGGVSIGSQFGYLYEEGGIASPDGHCRAFDAQAKGTVGGNGAGVVVLKRLSNALADHDTICAIIKGTAINNDGSLKVGYTAPSVDGQVDVIAEAQSIAGVDPNTITYIETHGTGTALGDPIEITALTKAFRLIGTVQQTGFCAVGSVKTNIGHLDAAAGVTGLIKAVLSLQHKAIPPSLHFEHPNPAIDFAHSPFYVNTALAHWSAGSTPRRAGVSSFGIGGTNAHVVLEEAPPMDSSSASRPWQLLLLSAKTSTALEKATSNLAAYLKTHSEQNLADVAYTLQVGRRIFSQRRAIVCQDVSDAIAALENLEPTRVFTGNQEQTEQSVAFMFPGQGAQYVDMGRELYALEPTFRNEVDRCSVILESHLGLDLRTVLYPNPEDKKEAAEQLDQTWLTQPALFVIEYALAQLWMSWNIKPRAMIGHSIGEYVAACLAGVFSLEDALALVAARGRLMQSLIGGGMVAVGLAESEVRVLLGDTLSLAAVNGLAMCVVSGPMDAIAALEQQLKEKGVRYQRLHTSHAFHSTMMEPVLGLFADEVKRVERKSPQLPFISNLTGEWITDAEATDPDYWVQHLRNTVRFGDGLGQLFKESTLLLLEIGPGRTLTSLAVDHPDKTTGQVSLPSLRHAQDIQSDQKFILATLGKLWLAGVPVDWTTFYQAERRHHVPLPTYPFERQRFWIEPSKEKVQAQSQHIYKKKNVADWPYTPSWLAKPLHSDQRARMPENCLVFADTSSFGLALVKSLQQKGVTVATAQAGTEWKRLEHDQYILDPLQVDHYEKLFFELAKTGKIPDTIVHFWSLTNMEEQASGPEYFAQIQPLGFNSLVYLTQALKKHNIYKSIHIEVLSNGIYSLEGTIQPEKATILGPCRVIPQELNALTCRYNDIVLPLAGTQQEIRLVNQLVRHVFADPSNGTYAWRDGQRWEQSFDPLELQKETDGPQLLREMGVYLITGGLGYVGLMLAEYLAKQVKAKLILTSRSTFPSREDWGQYLSLHKEKDDISRQIQRIHAIEELGAEVTVLHADVTNLEAMQAVISYIDTHWGGLHGVFHAAGAVKNMNSVQEMTVHEYQAHFLPKVYGLFVLEQVLRGRKLDFCLLFSSLASILGGLGFAAYSAANNFMDASAHKYSHQSSIRWISVNWDGWQIDEAQENERIVGSTLAALAMTPEESMSMLERILCSEQVESQIAVSTANIQARINQWIKLESLKDTMPGKQSQAVVLQSRPSLNSTYLAPRNQTERLLASIWQELLGIEQIGIHDNFFELGGHSLLAVQLAARIQQTFQCQVVLSSLFQNPTVAQFAPLIAERVIHSWSPIIPIQPYGSRTPLFCMHPAGGFASGYTDLAHHLDPDQPLYGLQSRGLDEHQIPYQSIDEMATCYREAIQQVQARGPYFLAGWSMGGFIAYEIAQQFRQQGEEIAFLGLLDTYIHPEDAPKPTEHMVIMEYLLGNLHEAGQSIEHLDQMISETEDGEIVVKAFAIAQERGLILPDLSLASFQRYVEVYKTNAFAGFYYRPQPYLGTATLFVCQDTITENIVNTQSNIDRWRTLIKNLEVRETPGNHQNMILPPHVDHLAAEISSCLQHVTSFGQAPIGKH